jgi:hypothetical protein
MDQPSAMTSSGGVLRAQPGSLQQREISVSRVRRFSPRLLVPATAGLLIAASLGPAAGQNLDAGKPASQIFSEVCSNCHRSPREFRSNPGVGFLREHYTTGSEMASTMAAYISGGGGEPRAPGGPQQKRQPNPAAGSAARDTPVPPENVRDPRRAPPDSRAEATRSDPKTDPKTDPKADPKADPNARAVPATSAAARARPGAVVRAESTGEAKPPAPPAPPTPPKPVLEEFEE